MTADAAGSGHLRIEVLGPFAVSVDGRPVQVYVARLRRTLGQEAIRTESSGYAVLLLAWSATGLLR